MKKLRKVIRITIIPIVLYLLAIMPKLGHHKDMEALRRVLYAHRGLHDREAPENSMEAFKRAVENGYGIEMDVQLTRDRVPVVFHDFELKRMCGVEGKVRDYTYEELQQFPLLQSGERIPKFEDVLQMVNGKVPLIVEYKIEGKDALVCRLGDQLLASYPGLYCIESFNPIGVLWYRRNRPDIIRGQLSDGFTAYQGYRKPSGFAMENLLTNFITKPDFIAYNQKFAGNLSRRICRKLYRNTAVAYTIRSEEELAEARSKFDLYIFENFIPLEAGGK